jgi:hypothetical protein
MPQAILYYFFRNGKMFSRMNSAGSQELRRFNHRLLGEKVIEEIWDVMDP